MKNVRVSSESLLTNVAVLSEDAQYTVTADTNIHIRKGYSPYIDTTTNTWWEYDDTQQKFIDTGVTADYGSFQPITDSTLTSLWSQSINVEEEEE